MQKTESRILHRPRCLPSYVTSDSRKQVIFGVTSVRSSKPATYKLLWQHSASTVTVLTGSPKGGSRYKPRPSNPFETKDSVPHNHVTMNCSLSRSAENDQKPVTHMSHITWQDIKPGLLNVMTSSNQTTNNKGYFLNTAQSVLQTGHGQNAWTITFTAKMETQVFFSSTCRFTLWGPPSHVFFRYREPFWRG